MADTVDIGGVQGTAEFIDNSSDKLDHIIDRVESTQNAYAQFSGFVSDVFGPQYSASMDEITANAYNEISDLGEKTADSLKEFIENPLESIKGLVTETLDTLGPFGTGLAAIGGAALAAGTGLFELTEKAAESGERILTFSRITGGAVDQVSVLGQAATIGGSSLDGLQGMLLQMQRRMDAGGPAADKFNSALADLHVNAAEFRASDPTERISLLSTAMHEGAGNTNLMSDAIAVMGRGALQNMPLLTKNFEDLKDRAQELGYIWSKDDTEAAESFNVATASMKVQLETVATTVGVALLPAMTGVVDVASRTILAFEHIADLGGLVSGSYGVLKGVLGEYSDEEERNAAVSEDVARRWKEQTEKGVDLHDAAYNIARQMMEIGYSEDRVISATGLTTEEIKRLKTAFDEAKKSGAAYADALDRVNDALSADKVNVDKISPSIKGWVADMSNAGVKMEDMIIASGLSEQAIGKIVQQYKDSTTFSQKWGEAITNLLPIINNPVWDGTAESMIKLGASVKDVATYFGMTEGEAKRAAEAVKTFGEVAKIEAGGALEELQKKIGTTGEVSEKYFQDQTKSLDEMAKLEREDATLRVELTGNTFSAMMAKSKEWEDDELSKLKTSDWNYKQHFDLIVQMTHDKNLKIIADEVNKEYKSREALQGTADMEQAKLEYMQAHWDSFTDAQIQNQQRIADKALQAANDFGSSWDGALDEVKDRADRAAASIQASNMPMGTPAEQAALATVMGSPDVKALGAIMGNSTSLFSQYQELIATKMGALGFAASAGAGAKMKSFDDGGPVVGDQTAQVHDGEFVVPKSGALISGSGGRAIVVQIMPGAVQQMFPITSDRFHMQQVGSLLGDAVAADLRAKGLLR